LKEYKREVLRFIRGERSDYPPYPDNYFSQQTEAILDEYRDQVVATRNNGQASPDLPESLIVNKLDNTWHDTAEAVINNWIGKVYQITNQDRRLPFMPGIDPDDPLGLRK
jgi:homoserine O-succinyltransferase